MYEVDGGWGEIEKTRREDEDKREGSAKKNQLCPCTLLEITKISMVASMWHVPFVPSAKMDDKDQFC